MTDTFLSDPRQAALILTSGGMFTKQWYADPGTVWPVGSTYTVFTDSAGGIIATLSGTVATNLITYSSPPQDTDAIPAGAGFEVFLVTADGPYKIRYGRVLRKEVTFPNSPGQTTTFAALQFADDFQRAALGSKWVPISGKTSIHANTGAFGQQVNPSGVGVDFGALWADSSLRYYAPLNTDGVKTSATLIYPGAGHTTMMMCADQNLTTYIGVQFDTRTQSGHNTVSICRGTAPLTKTILTSVTVTDINDYDRFMCWYDPLTNTTRVYRGDSATPLVSWTDTTHSIPHGPGYRYVGFSWQATLFNTGPQITDWIAQDDLGAGVTSGT